MNAVSLVTVRSKLGERGFWLRARKICRRVFWSAVGLTAALMLTIGFLAQGPAKDVLTVVTNVLIYALAIPGLAWITSSVMAWWTLGRLRWGVFAPRTRRAHLLRIFDQEMAIAHEHRLHLVRVVRVYQVARRGTKCVVEHPDGVRQDAWFWSFNPKRRRVFLVRSDTGYGPRNSNMHVMFIGSGTTGHGVVGGIPPAAWRAARKRAQGR